MGNACCVSTQSDHKAKEYKSQHMNKPQQKERPPQKSRSTGISDEEREEQRKKRVEAFEKIKNDQKMRGMSHKSKIELDFKEKRQRDYEEALKKSEKNTFSHMVHHK